MFSTVSRVSSTAGLTASSNCYSARLKLFYICDNDFIMSSNASRDNVRRNLFGINNATDNTDTEGMSTEMQQQLMENTRQQSRNWNFDFANEVPLEGEPNAPRDNVRRNLFGINNATDNTDTEEMSTEMQQQLMENTTQQSRNWNFDFVNEVPLEGEWEWEIVV